MEREPSFSPMGKSM